MEVKIISELMFFETMKESFPVRVNHHFLHPQIKRRLTLLLHRNLLQNLIKCWEQLAQHWVPNFFLFQWWRQQTEMLTWLQGNKHDALCGYQLGRNSNSICICMYFMHLFELFLKANYLSSLMLLLKGAFNSSFTHFFNVMNSRLTCLFWRRNLLKYHIGGKLERKNY